MPIDPKRLAASLARGKRRVKAVGPSSAIEVKYARTLLALVRRMSDFTLRFAAREGIITDSPTDFLAAFDREFKNPVADLSNKYAEAFANESNKYHAKAFVAEFNQKLGINLQKVINQKSDRVGRAVKASIKWNSDLIVSLADEYKQRARDAIHETFMGGDNDGLTLRQRLEQIEGVTESRAKLIARDQTQKLCSDLNQARQNDIGIRKYIWSGLDDGRERDSHVANNNQVFSWDSPPEDTGHPGEDVQCRCAADPYLEDFLGNLEMLAQAEPIE